ncbi:MAG: polysaccharide pyruvyl transferase family protein [Bacteroidota bacterium]
MITTNIFVEEITRQQILLFDCLNQLLNKGEKVALLDFPNHNNVGDNAIWLGEKAALKKMGVEIVYQCDLYSFSEKALRSRLDERGVVLLHGGGNLGTVWPEHQMFRERMIESLPDYRLIQLPQSVYFKNDSAKYRFSQIAKTHSNFHILLRDRQSFQILKELDLNVKLCPDMALALGPVEEQGKSLVDVVWLSRSDHETVGDQRLDTSVSVEKLDWLVGEPGVFYSKFIARFTVRIRRLVQRIFRNSKFFRDHLWRSNVAFFDLLARSRFKRGIRTLSRGKIVVTDRLHGHILSTLIGKHQVLLDNHYRKIGNYLDCFASSSEGIFYLGDDNSDFEHKVLEALNSKQKE